MTAKHGNHTYGGRAASRTVTMKGAGTFHLCLECAQAAHTANIVIADRPLYDTDNTRQRCQCEHESHMPEAS